MPRYVELQALRAQLLGRTLMKYTSRTLTVTLIHIHTLSPKPSAQPST